MRGEAPGRDGGGDGQTHRPFPTHRHRDQRVQPCAGASGDTQHTSLLFSLMKGNIAHRYKQLNQDRGQEVPLSVLSKIQGKKLATRVKVES